MGTLRKIKVHGLFLKQLIEAPLYERLWPDHIAVMHYCIRNWGDIINPVFVEAISGKKVRSIDIEARNKSPLSKSPNAVVNHMVIGSTLHHADCQTVVWGSGLIDAHLRPRQVPRKIAAVRGPLTAQALRRVGIDCPDVYGDPALLLPRLFPIENSKKYKLGIIPHNNDQNYDFPKSLRKDPEIVFINLRHDVMKVLETIVSCQAIVSSSLHGLITADAYGIRSRRLVLNNDLTGGDFKFNDYYSSIGQFGEEAIRISSDTTKNRLLQACTLKQLDIDLDLLYRACPFKKS